MAKSFSIGIERNQLRVVQTKLTDVRVADTFYTRLVGLLNRSMLNESEGLLIKPCSSIHTVGMRFAIDLVFLDSKNKVLGLCSHVAPYKFKVAPKGTVSVLEVSQGNVKRTGIHLDDILLFD